MLGTLNIRLSCSFLWTLECRCYRILTLLRNILKEKRFVMLGTFGSFYNWGALGVQLVFTWSNLSIYHAAFKVLKKINQYFNYAMHVLLHLQNVHSLQVSIWPWHIMLIKQTDIKKRSNFVMHRLPRAAKCTSMSLSIFTMLSSFQVAWSGTYIRTAINPKDWCAFPN